MSSVRKPTQLSRSEVDLLVFDKLELIKSECEELEHWKDGKLGGEDITAIRKHLARIQVEAKRAASLIESYGLVSKSGHCLHCGKTYAEHEDLHPAHVRMQDEPRVKPNDPNASRCRALQKYFESAEVETYQYVAIAEATDA